MAQPRALVLVFLTLALTLYGQFIIKWRVLAAGHLPQTPLGISGYIFHLLLNPWVISGLFGAFLASICWMLAMTKLPLSYAYPFMSLAFPATVILSGLIFHEAITWPKIIGSVLILSGIVVLAQG